MSSVLPFQAAAAVEPLPLHALPPAPELGEETFASSSSEGEPADVQSLGDAEEVFFFRAKSGIIHVAAPSELCVGVQHSSLWMKPACGMLSAELVVVASLPTGARLCKHKACQGLLSSVHSFFSEQGPARSWFLLSSHAREGGRFCSSASSCAAGFCGTYVTAA